ncbi:HAD family hydrolase [Bacillus kwashiorkori]|uniref:HAD family hydrolase n=1 Tax=Bacillus kwashiorkori TaxID=1522318 RepID=UPI000780BC75|nr:HAD-IA family hydrolase [Bacillus kwashiorkori]
MLKALIFDFDGTIVDTESLWFEVYYEYFKKKYNYQLPIETFSKGIGSDGEFLFKLIGTDLGEELNMDECLIELHSLFSDHSESLVVRKGVVNLINDAHKAGYKLAIASSSTKQWVLHYLHKFNLTNYFPIIKTRDDVHEVKPNPELYFKTIEALKLHPSEIVVMEDSYNGSMAATRANLRCIAVPNNVTKYTNFPKHIEVYQEFTDITLTNL